jgi:hypothetical protein
MNGSLGKPTIPEAKLIEELRSALKEFVTSVEEGLSLKRIYSVLIFSNLIPLSSNKENA